MTDLVLLAAGLGSRFGAPKQLAPVGAGGEPLLAITAEQGRRAGFDRLVVVTRAELETQVTAAVRTHLRGFPAEVVCQDEHGPPRSRPWGTGHAVAALRGTVTGAFGLANADDFYGDPSLALLFDEVRVVAAADQPTASIVAFDLGDTLSSHGGVSRAVLELGVRLDGAREVTDLSERMGLRRRHAAVIDDQGANYPAGAQVSMNLWALPGWFPEAAYAAFEALLARGPGEDDELALPAVVSDLHRRGDLGLRTVHSTGSWCGLTHPEDLEDVRVRVRSLG